MTGEVGVWVILGVLIGVTARFAIPRGRVGILATVGVAVAGALVGGFAADALLGDGASVRMTIHSGGSFAGVLFGLVPAVLALVGAMVALGLTAARPSIADRGYRPRRSGDEA